ncbi:hypothetical protein OV203_45990 [Nannocystis sp. ILAH1]|uniref:hypothetical protein n=1 Tax=unclassified Nannocystis TaxID=2627009 RepID=UPI002270F494|nr:MULTISPECIES: hypothetical protein [unclassified Nannocystis]MCY0994563.1 hypothetical protein [Nannocystis sp. ILAH1]MCY1063169.1 hypothetical protein [Nannocystis sp. RBIL2]
MNGRASGDGPPSDRDAPVPGPSLPAPTFPFAAVLLDTGPVLLLGGSENPYQDPTLSAFLLE